MTTTVMKTKAERAIPEQFEAALAGLPGSSKAKDARRAAMARFVDLGLPHRRIEEWKYTDLRSGLKEAFAPAITSGQVVTEATLNAALGAFAAIASERLVFVDGKFEPALSTILSGQSALISAVSAHAGVDRSAGFDAKSSNAVSALNVAFASDGAVVNVPASVALARPLMLVFLSSAAVPSTVTTRNFIDIGNQASATIVEVHAQIGGSSVHTNCGVELRVGDGAVVDHVKIVLGSDAGVHLSNWDVKVGASALYRAAQLTPSAGLARNEVHISLDGRDSTFDFAGIALGRNTDHIDTTMEIRHIAPGCQSRELFKTVIDDRARAVFQGKVYVAQAAQKTDGKQMAQALMLSPDAEFDSKPELEIYADDVACGHGSTCAEIDPNLIFYCQSRGIPEAQARALLIESFVGDAIEKIDDPAIRRAMSEVAFVWLAGKSS